MDKTLSNFTDLIYTKNNTNLRFANIWLRDHCRCNLCYNSSTNQRKNNIIDIPINIQTKSTKIIDSEFFIEWEDGHKSVYEIEFLHTCQLKQLRKIENFHEPLLWNREEILSSDYADVDLGELVKNDEIVKQVVGSLINFGLAFIENVPPNETMTEMAIRRIFPVMKTFFGEMFTFSDVKDHADTAYTSEYLGSHTDNTYFCDAAGLQSLHCIYHEGTGGETFLVDGFKVANILKVQNPKAFETLCKVNVPSEYIEDNQHHFYSAPIIRTNKETKLIEQIRLNINDRSTFNSIPQNDMYHFYASFKEFLSIVENEENRWRFKLNPGTLLIFDNWRVFHGREKYTGKRQMTGCYVQRTDFMSKARVLGFLN